MNVYFCRQVIFGVLVTAILQIYYKILKKNNNRKRYFFEYFYFSEPLSNTIACYLAKRVIDGGIRASGVTGSDWTPAVCDDNPDSLRAKKSGSSNHDVWKSAVQVCEFISFFSPQNRGWNSFRQTLGTFL